MLVAVEVSELVGASVGGSVVLVAVVVSELVGASVGGSVVSWANLPEF